MAANAGAQYGQQTAVTPMVEGVTAKWGVTFTGELTLDEAIDFVKSGKGYVWMGGTGDRDTTPFTSGGHVIAMVGVTADGSLTIANSHNPPMDQIRDWPRSVVESTVGWMRGVSK